MEQVVPEYPDGHVQVKDAPLLAITQVPPFKHGLFKQAFVNIWQLVPE